MYHTWILWGLEIQLVKYYSEKSIRADGWHPSIRNQDEYTPLKLT